MPTLTFTDKQEFENFISWAFELDGQSGQNLAKVMGIIDNPDQYESFSHILTNLIADYDNDNLDDPTEYLIENMVETFREYNKGDI